MKFQLFAIALLATASQALLLTNEALNLQEGTQAPALTLPAGGKVTIPVPKAEDGIVLGWDGKDNRPLVHKVLESFAPPCDCKK